MVLKYREICRKSIATLTLNHQTPTQNEKFSESQSSYDFTRNKKVFILLHITTDQISEESG
jgi:hypothetical protein